MPSRELIGMIGEEESKESMLLIHLDDNDDPQSFLSEFLSMLLLYIDF